MAHCRSSPSLRRIPQGKFREKNKHGRNHNTASSNAHSVPGPAVQPAHHHAAGRQRRTAGTPERKGAGSRSRRPRVSDFALPRPGRCWDDRHHRLRRRGHHQPPAPNPPSERRRGAAKGRVGPRHDHCLQPRRERRHPQHAPERRERAEHLRRLRHHRQRGRQLRGAVPHQRRGLPEQQAAG